jgi:hypothetical protein
MDQKIIQEMKEAQIRVRQVHPEWTQEKVRFVALKLIGLVQ